MRLSAPAEQDEYIAAIEVHASEINNGGFERQIDFLLGAGVSREAIEEVLNANH